MSITTQTQVSALSGFPVDLPNVPVNYQSLIKRPGILRTLLNDNSQYVYHEFSPYESNISSDRQPFVYRYIDDPPNKIFSEIPNLVQLLPQSTNITRRTVSDVVRVSKFMNSSWGSQFIVNQIFSQQLNSFDETRIYNPISPILSTLLPPRPLRHVVQSLFGIVDAITGINFESGFPTPSSTVGDSALPLSLLGKGLGTGLIRGADAGKGFSQIQLAWPISNPNYSNGSGLITAFASMASSMTNAASSMFSTTQISQPEGTLVRADESTYGLMSVSSKLGLQQQWFPSLITTVDNPTYSPSPLNSINNTISGVVSGITSIVTNPIGSITGIISNLLSAPAGGSQTLQRFKLIAMPNNQFYQKRIDSGLIGLNMNINQTIGGRSMMTSKSTGYSISNGDRYGDDVGRPVDVGEFTNSDMMVQYSYYANSSNKYTSKFSDTVTSTQLNNALQSILTDINLTKTYYAANSPSSYLLPGFSGNSNFVQYDNWTSKQQQSSLLPGVSGEYSNGNTSNPPTIDAFVSTTNNLRMATSFYSDGINMLGIVPKNMSITNTVYPKWTQYRPYNDDTIAFFFYDVVNEKYIPFRATVKGISEGNTAFWDELRFVGRADQLYSYNGFSRTLSFTFNVVINSVTELLPSWKKINYIASAVKPSNYTTGKNGNQTFNRFIVPPMFMLTIGDLYKFQPVIMTSINVNIPDDASWETLNEINSAQGWSYLNGLIKSPNLGKNYGQLPREVEIAITCNLLEKERATVGGSHFGHEPRIDNWENVSNTNDIFLVSGSVPYLPSITTLHQGLVEWNNNNTTTSPNTSTTAVNPPTSTTPPVTPPTPKNGPTRQGNALSSGLPTLNDQGQPESEPIIMNGQPSTFTFGSGNF